MERTGPQVDVGALLRDGAARGLSAGLGRILGTAVERAPKDTEELVESGDTRLARDGTAGAVYFTADHAVRQHEDMHLTHDPGRGPKFLETAMADDRTAVARDIQQGIRKALGT